MAAVGSLPRGDSGVTSLALPVPLLRPPPLLRPLPPPAPASRGLSLRLPRPRCLLPLFMRLCDTSSAGWAASSHSISGSASWKRKFGQAARANTAFVQDPRGSWLSPGPVPSSGPASQALGQRSLWQAPIRGYSLHYSHRRVGM